MINKMRTLEVIAIFVIVLLALPIISAEQTVRQVDIPLGHEALTTPNQIVMYNYTVDMPDGISEILSLEFYSTAEYLAGTKVYGGILVNEQVIFCDPSEWSVPTWNVDNYEIIFDCSSLVQQTGWTGNGDIPLTFTFMADNFAGNVKPRVRMTYKNEPKKSFKFFGTDYIVGDNGTIFLQLLDDEKSAVTNSTCYIDAWYPDKSQLLDDELMTYHSDGLYYRDVSIPSQTGVYMLSARCGQPETAYSDDFTDYSGLEAYENISVSGSEAGLSGTAKTELPANQATVGDLNMTDNFILFHFDNDSTYGESDTFVYDFSGTGRNGTPQANAAPNSTGVINGSYMFDGNGDYVLIDQTEDWAGWDVTIVGWVYLNAISPSNNIIMLGRHGSTVLKQIQVGMEDDNRVMFSTYNTNCYNTHTPLYTTETLTAGTWYHLAFVLKDGVSKTIYIDGDMKVNSTAGQLSMGSCSQKTSIGSNIRAPTTTSWDGLIDEVAVYNRSLGPEEIEAIYEAGVGTGALYGYLQSNPINLSGTRWYEFDSTYDYEDGNITFLILDGSNNTICTGLGNISDCANQTSPIKLWANLSRVAANDTSPTIDIWSLTWGNATTYEEVKGAGEMNVLSWVNPDKTVNITATNLTATVNNTAVAEAVWNWSGGVGSGLLDILANAIWSFTPRNLTYYEAGEVTSINESALEEIWGYSNRSLTNYTSNYTAISNAVWAYSGTIGANVINQLAQGVWEYSGTPAVSLLNNVSHNTWNFATRNLTWYNMTDTTNYTKINDEIPELVWNYSDRTVNVTAGNVTVDTDEVWNYSGEINPNITGKFVNDTWNATARYTHGEIV